MNVAIKIKRWAAWAPGAETLLDWQRWADDDLVFADKDVPKLAHVPAMQRRRMSLMSKMALQVAYGCLGEVASPMPMVFSSRHGEIVRTEALLQSLAEKEPLSPTAFSMSVHNTAAGLQSILTKDISPSTTVSAGKDSFCQAMLEAYSRSIQAGGQDVLLVHGDTVLPSIFDAHSDEVMLDHALALLICAENKTADFSLTWDSSDAEASQPLPHSLAFIRFLCREDEARLMLNSSQRQWCWSRMRA